MVTKKSWGKIADGSEVFLYTITNKNGLALSLSDYGGTFVSLLTPDRNGNLGDIVLGYDTPSEYENSNAYFGAMIGRYANRIKRGKFTVNGKEFNITTNEGLNTLHSGSGYHTKIFDVSEFENGVILSYVDPDGMDGFGGNVNVKITVTLNDNDELILDYKAVSDQDTYVNLTNHSYFNLACEGNVLAHEVFLDADVYTEVDAELIPTDVVNVEGTKFDFRTMHAVKDGGYDHNYGLNKGGDKQAEVYEPVSGRVITASTTMPAVQFYVGGGISEHTGKGGIKYGPNSGLCLETQFYPDTPNRPDFPDALLKAGEEYHQVTTFKFSVK